MNQSGQKSMARMPVAGLSVPRSLFSSQDGVTRRSISSTALPSWWHSMGKTVREALVPLVESGHLDILSQPDHETL